MRAAAFSRYILRDDIFDPGLYYSFLPLNHIANPLVPYVSLSADAPQEKKFKNKIDSYTRITIKKGRAIPRSIRITPRVRRKPGEFIYPAGRIMSRLGLEIGGGTCPSYKPGIKCDTSFIFYLIDQHIMEGGRIAPASASPSVELLSRGELGIRLQT